MQVVRHFISSAARVNNYADCEELCDELGGGQACVHNYAELDAMLFTFNREDTGDIMVLNRNHNTCYTTNNWWLNDPKQAGAHLRENSCRLDSSHRCVCQSSQQTCDLGPDWHFQDHTGSIAPHPEYYPSTPYTGSYGYPEPYYPEHSALHGWAPEMLSFVLFSCFVAGAVSHHAFNVTFPTATKRFPLTATACGAATTVLCILAIYSVSTGHGGTRIDGLSFAACIFGGGVTFLAGIWDCCTCCSPLCCGESCRARTLRGMYLIGAGMSVVNALCMAVDAGQSQCAHNLKRQCTVRLFQAFACVFYALQALLLAYIARSHAQAPARSTSGDTLQVGSEPTPGPDASAPPAADTVIYNGGVPGVHTHVGASAESDSVNVTVPAAVPVSQAVAPGKPLYAGVMSSRRAWVEPTLPPVKANLNLKPADAATAATPKEEEAEDGMP
mmetsp:Transcript_50716/g.101317  ORF Transcript_50716/g.101317 Transcript_50716/m.101317 type:complete len:443 (+) Transcript_50716:183-1511(+)